MRNRDGKLLTPAQIAYRNSILSLKSKVKKRKFKPAYVATVTTTEQYIDNCFFWINEYREGRTSIDEYLKAIESMKQHCETILKSK